MKTILTLLIASLSFASSCDNYIQDAQNLINKLPYTHDKSLKCFSANMLQNHTVNILKVCTLNKSEHKQQIKNLIKLTEVIDKCD